MIPANLFQKLDVARIAADHPIAGVDVGSRGGFQDDLAAIAFAVDMLGFEPDPEARARLTARPDPRWRSARILPTAIGPEAGPRVLSVPILPESATLREPDPALGRRFDKPGYFDVAARIEVETAPLDAALRAAGAARADWLKIDIEGVEPDVLAAAPATLESLLAAKVEVAFLPFRRGQKLAHHVGALFHDRGFELMAIIEPAHWRRASGHIHPFPAAADPPYSRGQIVQCDFLFFAAPDRLAGQPDAAIRMALIAMATGYFDHALTLLETPETAGRIAAAYGLDVKAVVRQASRAYGRRAFADALHAQLRGLVPFARHGRHLFS